MPLITNPVKYEWNTTICIWENIFENGVCKMAASLFPCQCVWNVKVGTKWPPLFCRRHFKCISISLKSTLLFLSIMWSSRAYWQYVIIDAGNDWAPNRRQAIAWTSDSLVLRCIYGTRFSSIYGVVLVQCQGIILTTNHVGFPVRVCALNFLVINIFHDVVARIESRCVIKAKHVLLLC